MKRFTAKTFLTLGLASSLAGFSVPAQANSAAVDYFRGRADRSNVPSLLTQDDRTYYRDLFGAIERSDWAKVQEMFAKRQDGPLHQVALAEYYLAPTSPKIELDALNAWLAKGTDLPQA
ncbi:MAG: lytic transglycosylase domain-containing protein, partial [Novosphingobium sp.]